MLVALHDMVKAVQIEKVGHGRGARWNLLTDRAGG